MEHADRFYFPLDFLFFFLTPSLGPFTQRERLIASNTGGVISAASRSIAFNIKQTKDVWDDRINLASGLNGV